MSNLVEHARRELELVDAGRDIYGEMLPDAVIELIEVFAKQGHSGMSAILVTDMFNKLARFEALSPLTDDPDEWHKHPTDIAGRDDLWQNKRDSSAFSNDGGKTYYSVNDNNRAIHVAKHKEKN